ncbi:hypothetical protein FH972_021630 [Carpinus fangiana]|uniref:CST complex subunit Stn1 N-terminal domain-containing protein n=1 Tax=Carpinus fangiana TaxID=176857 RepID=A0A5N6KPX1_9ROSI|nr:hypothetical protein FH972_021630 [Carpinus fangiana]
MTDADLRGYGPIYPAYCHRASPTYWKWVKLAVADVHALRSEGGFEGQNTFFHLNHPIRHVYLCGTIVAIDYFERFAILTLDDSSGLTIEVKIALVTKTKVLLEKSAVQPGEEATTLENVKITRSCQDTRCALKHILINGCPAEVGTVLIAKGTLDKYRGSFQLKLLRTSILKDAEEELRIWREYADFCTKVLYQQWHLSLEQVQELEMQDRERLRRDQDAATKEARTREKREKRIEARRAIWRAKVKHDREKLERQHAAEEQTLNGNALDARDKAHDRQNNL